MTAGMMQRLAYMNKDMTAPAPGPLCFFHSWTIRWNIGLIPLPLSTNWWYCAVWNVSLKEQSGLTHWPLTSIHSFFCEYPGVFTSPALPWTHGYVCQGVLAWTETHKLISWSVDGGGYGVEGMGDSPENSGLLLPYLWCSFLPRVNLCKSGYKCVACAGHLRQ